MVRYQKMLIAAANHHIAIFSKIVSITSIIHGRTFGII